MRRFLDIYQSTQNSGKAVQLLLTHTRNNGSCRSAANKNAASWVQAAVVTEFSQFDLFTEPGKQEDAAAQQDHHHYIVLQKSSEKLNPMETTGPRKPSYNGVKPPPSHGSVSDKSNLEGNSRLKESAILADELVRVSSQWFLKYLESSLNKGFFTKEEGNGKESLLVHLKEVNRWLDDLIFSRTGTSEKVEDLRKKLQRFLLGHIESAMGGTR